MKIHTLSLTKSQFHLVLIPIYVYLFGFILFLFSVTNGMQVTRFGVTCYMIVPLYSSLLIFISVVRIKRVEKINISEFQKHRYISKSIVVLAWVIPFFLLADRYSDITDFVLNSFSVREMFEFGKGFSVFGKLILMLSFVYLVLPDITKNYIYPTIMFIFCMLILGNRQVLMFYIVFFVVNELILKKWNHIRFKIIFGLASALFLSFVYQFMRTGFSPGFFSGLISVGGQESGTWLDGVLVWLQLYFPNPRVFSTYYDLAEIPHTPFLYTIKFFRDILYSSDYVLAMMDGVKSSIEVVTSDFPRQWASGYLQIYFDFGFYGVAGFMFLLLAYSILSCVNIVLKRFFCTFIIMHLFILPIRDTVIFWQFVMLNFYFFLVILMAVMSRKLNS